MRRRGRRQAGLALVCSLMLLVAAMAIGVAVTRGAFMLMAAARNEGERVVARAAAEAALRDAEHDIAGSVDPARAAHFAPAGVGGFVDGCGSGAADLGLCRLASPAAWERIDLAGGAGVLVPYGRYTGAAFPAGAGGMSQRPPGYLIEKLELAGATPAHGAFYRITAIGFGARATTQVVLQSIYRKPDVAAPAPGGAGTGTKEGEGEGEGEPAGGSGGSGVDSDSEAEAAGPGPPPAAPPPALPAGRIGWREIANLPELHARANQ